ncbi:hypothetical protein MBM_08624 [Drepanopeziza brunnea f. sp. 'multigermtubi' MB_m1]|uniref:Uncharacterized protein n=1 Tax=Marssonina brunnea f. sp. multigermtubi (strain MB_m1) TaxID=1072389 RepID=K1WK19_MARBU|nr:uncharacterized protein MBM_08624 [Drepanopeziza brunnea f. sp. 'multigermtubi' MB_m1]EKD13181.1 hypothetical protein MBM_08624 [Drepanopeziza brunnea f. sp. 'multigermtubi' MB_m1]
MKNSARTDAMCYKTEEGPGPKDQASELQRARYQNKNRARLPAFRTEAQVCRLVQFLLAQPPAKCPMPTPFDLPWGVPPSMESPRLYKRPASTASSSMTSRSSVELKHKSLLSIRSSIVYESSRAGTASVQRNLLKYLWLQSLANEDRLLSPYQHRRDMEQLEKEVNRCKVLVTNRENGVGFYQQNPVWEDLHYSKRRVQESARGNSTSNIIRAEEVTSTKWWGAARCALYEDIQMIGCDSILHTKKRFKLKYGTRLRLLRKTPRISTRASWSKKEQDEYLELLASLIVACPNLERFPGFYSAYDHEFTKLVHALSTRAKLTEKVRIISASPYRRQHRFNISADADNEFIDFFGHHSNWTYLKTLVLHCSPGGTIDSLVFTDIFYSSPSLENILVSSYPATSFNGETLLSLPSLKSVRLDNLPGVTADGLSSYGSHARTDFLTSLSLISLPLLSQPVLTRLFSHLKSLVRSTISQAPSPSLPNGVEIYLHPYLASSTLQYLHWEFTNPSDRQATDIFAKSTESGGFPALRTLRAPTDPDGTLQRLCRPRDRIEHQAD